MSPSRRTIAALLLPGGLGLAVTVAAIATPAPAPGAPPATSSCSRDAAFEGYSDALDKARFAGTDVGGLSALAADPRRPRTLRALVDNQGDTAARFYDVRLGAPDSGPPAPRLTRVTTLKRPEGTPYTGRDFDGEGLVGLADGSVIASSETEPSIRRFSRSGVEQSALPVPESFRVAPAGKAQGNLTFEGLGLARDGHNLWAGMEGPLAPDGTTDDGGSRLRLVRYERSGTEDWGVAGQVGYVTDPSLGLSEVQVVNRGQLLVLERGFVAGQGNTIRIYQAFLAGADDVSAEPTLAREGVRLVAKRLLVDLGDCPSADVTSPGSQPNPLLDNVEGMVLSPARRAGGRTLTLVSDDNFSASQVTRFYELKVRLRGEPVLLKRATYDALRFQPGPPSGQTGADGANGVEPPFGGQPVPGFSALLSDESDGATGTDRRFWGMPDNGFGAKNNSRDFLLRVYHVRARWRTAYGGSGRLDLDRFISLRDPDRRLGFDIVNEDTPERLLTGGDLVPESVQRGADGTLWFGEEFGPLLVHTTDDGRVLDAPVELPGVRSAESPYLALGEVPNLPSSRGFEAMGASKDGRRLYPILEGPLKSDADQTVRRIYEFDTQARAYTDRSWAIRLSDAAHVIGDAQVIEGRRLVFIERDNAEGPAARVKRLIEVDLDDAPESDGSLPTRVVADLLRIRDPLGISLPGLAGAFGLGDPFAFALQSVESVLPLGGERVMVANDNNFPGSSGRAPARPDDVEAIVMRVPGL